MPSAPNVASSDEASSGFTARAATAGPTGDGSKAGGPPCGDGRQHGGARPRPPPGRRTIHSNLGRVRQFASDQRAASGFVHRKAGHSVLACPLIARSVPTWQTPPRDRAPPYAFVSASTPARPRTAARSKPSAADRTADPTTRAPIPAAGGGAGQGPRPHPRRSRRPRPRPGRRAARRRPAVPAAPPRDRRLLGPPAPPRPRPGRRRRRRPPGPGRGRAPAPGQRPRLAAAGAARHPARLGRHRPPDPRHRRRRGPRPVAGGRAGLRRSADRIGFLTGARWVEETVGTNGIAAALRARRPMQVHSSEHYLRSHHAWTCVAAPVHDPGTGRLVGAINLSGPAHTVQPYLLQLTATAARLAETELRARRLESLHQLRTLAAPLLARVTGPALVVDAAGWTAAAAGLPPPTRLRLPSEGWNSAAVHWLPSLGECAIEPLADGWLIRPVRRPENGRPGDAGAAAAEQAQGARLRVDLRRPDRPELSVHGVAGSWSHALSPRHAELLLLLAVERDGRSAAQLADALFGDPGRTVTVRAELSRLRRHLGGLLAHRPYRFADSVLVTVLGPEDPYDLLPASSAPAVRRLRAGLAAGTVRLPGVSGVQSPATAGPPGAAPVPVPRGPADGGAAAPRRQPPASSADSWASVGP
ncbi:GAF domain-containing protein [Kitasatospora aburaviensis]